MSTDDFQTKYTSFIESVVKSTVAETTKLFETMVDELKAELTKVKTENEALKQTCRQMEDVKTQAIRESGQRGGPKMRDTAVQCDLLPGYLLPEVQPVKQSTDEQNKQCNQEDLVYTLLKDHDYDAAKDENSKLTVSLSNHEDYEPLIVSRNILCAVADSPPNSACGNETEDPEIDKQCLKREVREKLETLVAPVHPSLEEDHNLHEVSPITKDISDPHLQLTKTQFLAQLAVSPVIQDSQKVLTIESTDVQSVCEGTSTDGRRKSQKNSIVARLQCHLKMHSQTKRTKTIPEQLTGKQHPAESPKKHRLENFSTTDQESTNELICVCTNVASSLSPTGTLSETEFFQGSPRNHQSTDISSTESRTTFEPVSVNPPNLGVSKSSSALKNTTDSALIIPSLPQTEINVSHVNSITMGDTIEDITINSKRPFFAEGCASKTFESIIYPQSSSTTDTPDMTNMKLSPQSSFPSNPCTNNAVSEKSGDSSQSPASSLTIDKLCLTQTTFPVGITGKPSTNKDETSQNKLKATTVCLRSSTTQVTTTPLKTKFPPGSQKRRFSAKENAGNEKTQLNCHRDQSVHTKTSPSPPPRTRLTRDYTCPKKSQLPPLSQNESTPVIQNESSLIKNFPSPKMPYCESLRSCNFAKEEHTTKKIKRKSNSLFGKTVAASAWWPKLAKNSASSSTTVESTAKKSRFNQTCTISENTVKVQNAKQLSKAAKATNIANIEQTKLKNTKQVIHHYTSDVTGNKYTSQLVWTAPTTRAREAASLREMRLAILPVQRETRSPRSQNRSVVSPQCLSHHLTHVKDPPIVSPLHPLAVIGERLLKNQCGECGRVLSSSAALESHVSLHTGHRPFSCTLCGKSFPDSKGLKRHGRVHRNGRIHICQQCGKGFVYGFGLTKHLQMVHGKVKPFVCQICNKAFFTKRDVEAHIRIHTGEKPFQCHLCEKKFARRVELNVHLRWHNGEKRHWCPYCGKGFLDYNNMKRHKYIHTGEKPHSCPHCPKHFTQSGHLKKHVKNVHKVK
ncbi:uncharacterized protein LOC133403775 isoform X3 [Phycodurus eques]|uniref:uncharacterized protein LOC133403775 isoform X3 n=1 Tax=Phycodurus eques TaxID=693459 RepID=UPI002ACDAD42|nr:uncharacterized protein LOC133403775 isoform X3 [Phycodurus eques]